MTPSSTPIVAGTAPTPVRLLRSRDRPRPRPAPGTRERPAWSRARRPHRRRRAPRAPPRRRRSSSLMRADEPRVGHRAELLHAAGGRLEREVGPADDPPRCERVSRAGGVDHLRDREGGALVAVERATSRSPLDDPLRTRGAGRRRSLPLASFAKTASGASCDSGFAELGGSCVADGAPGCEIDADRGSLRPGDLGGTVAALRAGSRSSA